jgi:transposase
MDDATAQSTLRVPATQTRAPCPLGATPARRIPRDAGRPLADRPWAPSRVGCQRRVRTWLCRQRRCRRRLCTDRLPTSAAPWARRTRRLAQRLSALGVALGGTAGGRLGHTWARRVSRHTRRRLRRRPPAPDTPPPRVLGGEDVALRQRPTEGTILGELERRQPGAWWPDRAGDPVAPWLQAHPGVEGSTRARSTA